jgi:GNAT superfamily N-acetyltransferase
MECRPLDVALAERVKSWTYPAYRHLLDLQPGVRIDGPDRRPVRPFGFAAMDGDTPRGLLVGCLPDTNVAVDAPNHPELLSLFVAPKARRQGLGSKLVDEFEQAVAAAGFTRIEIVYMSGAPEIESLERILARHGWSEPTPRMLVLRGSLSTFVTAPWYGKYRLGSGLSLFSWSEVTPEDITRLQESQAAGPWIPEDLLPWRHRNTDESSVGIRGNEGVVGWVINHRVGDDLVRFTCSFIRRDLARRGRIVPAYSEAVRRAVEAGYKRIMFTVPMRHANMVEFGRRWCAPYLEFQGETRGASKDLGGAQA